MAKAKEKPLYTLYLRTASPDDPPSRRPEFVVTIIQKFDNTKPGAEMDFIYGRGKW